jgi:hypothetical protein
MGRHGHTPVWGPIWIGTTLLALGLSTACGFDAGVNASPAEGGMALPDFDAGLASPDADSVPQADAAPEPDAHTNVAMGTLTSSPLSGSIVLDGELDAQWQALEFRIFDIDDAEQLEALGTYQPDASVRFASLYDDDKLYLFFQVFDDILVDDSNDLFNDDSIEIYIDGLDDASGPYAGDDHWILVGASATYSSFGPNSIEIDGFIKTTDVGYNVEITLERSALGAGAASELGFNLGLNDDDGDGNSLVDAYGLWFVPDTPACENCCSEVSTNYAWCDTTRLGKLLFLP